MKKPHTRLTPVLPLAITNLVFFGATNAATVSPLVLVAGYVLVVYTLYRLLIGLIGLLRIYGIVLSGRRKRHVALYATVVIGLLVALQSIGGVSLRDILVLAPLVLLGYFYGSYAKTSSRDLQT